MMLLAAVLAFAVILSGYGFTCLFLPSGLRKTWLYFCPWIGSAFIITVGGLMNLGKIGMTSSFMDINIPGVIIINFLAGFLVVQAALNKKLLLPEKKDIFILLLLLVVSLLLNLHLTFFSANNPNYFFKNIVYEKLMAGEVKTLNEVEIGLTLLVVFLSVVLGKTSVDASVLELISRIYLAFSFFSGWFLVGQLKFFKNKIYFKIVCFSCLGWLFLRAINNSFNRVILVGLILIGLFLIQEYFTRVFTNKIKDLSFNFYDLTTSLILSALVLTNLTVFKYFTLGLISFSLTSAIIFKNWKAGFLAIKISMLLMLINPIMVGLSFLPTGRLQ